MEVRDPVCGMELPAEQAAARVEYEEKTYFFCSEACRKQFELDPAKYARGV